MTILSARGRLAVMVLSVVLTTIATGCRSVSTEVESPGADAGTSSADVTGTASPDATSPSSGSATSQAKSNAQVSTTASSIATTTSTTTTMLPWSLPQAQATQVAELMSITENLRGRAFHRRPTFEPMTADELSERYPSSPGAPRRDELRRHLALLELVGLAPDDSGVFQQAASALDPPVSAPFYDFARATVVVPGGGDPLDEYQQWVLVGELVHALAHQHEPLLVGSVRGVGTDPDRTAARVALLEGEALLVQSLYLDALPPERRAEVARQAAERGRLSRDGVPTMLLELARFPYRAGSSLATELYGLGGMAALDQAMDHPPESTEQVMHLARYRNQDSPVSVDPLRLSAEGYVVVEEGTWGERRWRTLLEHHSGPVNAARAAEGWGGDHYVMLWHPVSEDVVFAVRYSADSFADEAEMITAIRELITSGMDVGPSRVVDTVTEWVEGADYAILLWDLGEITLVLASDPVAGRSVSSQLGLADS